jgi:F-type H+-transporting ATPase subunit b
MPQFDVSSFSSQLFWLISFFLFLYVVVSRYLAPRLEMLISQRGQVIEDNISLAQQYNDQIKAIELHKTNLKHEIAAMIDDMRHKHQEMFDAQYLAKQESINKKIKQLQLNSYNDIQKYIEVFEREEPQYCRSLSQTIIQKITHKDADITVLEKLYDQYYQ